LETLLRTIGPERFLFGTGQPLRIPENSEAKLDLLDLTPDQRRMIENDNIVGVTMETRA
jgi:predicted TIM-barrel fold metal-dependent hydrolase